jgi:hypothetical protein
LSDVSDDVEVQRRNQPGQEEQKTQPVRLGYYRGTHKEIAGGFAKHGKKL